MKILQINKYYYKKGGSETVFFNTIQSLEKEGHEVIPFCLKDKKNNLSRYDNYFVDYPEMSSVGFFQKLKFFFYFFYNLDAKRKIEQLIKDTQPDIAHIHLLFNGISVSVLPILKKYNIPVVMTVHDYRLICPTYLFLDAKGCVCERCRTRNYLHCVKNKCKNNDRIASTMLALDTYFWNLFVPVSKYIGNFIFVSKFTYMKHVSYNQKYLEKGNVLPNWINMPADATVFYPQDKYYLYYGRLSREKGLSTLIRVAQELNIQLKIAGTGPLFEQEKDFTHPNIEFLGFKTGIELQELIQKAYFVIVPSEWYETFGLTAIEPQYLGKPVIGANIGAIPEIIKNGQNGFLFESGNSAHLKEVISSVHHYDEKTYLKIAENALAFAMEYTKSNNYYEKLMSIYSDSQKQQSK